MSHIKEFSRNANSYESYNVIQKEVASKLISMINGTPKKILDLGCGSGSVTKNLKFHYESLTGIDSAKSMCELHPKSSKIEVFCGDFESVKTQAKIQKKAPFDLIISSSALQWAKDFEKVVSFCKECSDDILFSVFTKGTFKTVYEYSGLDSFLPTSKSLINSVSKFYDISYEVKEYKLHFEDTLSMFRYIKKSGVSGGKNQLSITKTRELIKNYPLNYLEFEVIFIKINKNNL